LYLVPKNAAGLLAGLPPGLPKIENGATTGATPKQPQTLEIPIVAPLPEKLGLQFRRTEAVEAVNQSLQAEEAIQAATKGTEKTKAETNEEGLCSSGMTDQKQKLSAMGMIDQKQKLSAMGMIDQTPLTDDLIAKNGSEISQVAFRKPETIGEHFRNDVTIDEISMGEIDWDALDKRYRYTHISQGTMEGYCQEAVDAKVGLPYLGPKTHGDLMVDAMLLLDKAEGRKAPECWYAVAKKLRANPPVFSTDEKKVEDAGGHGLVYLGEPNEDIWRRVFEYAGVVRNPSYQFPACTTYRDCWQYLARLPVKPLPEPLAKVRDWLWENDAMPDKPALPPWK
jgi:hypothetical protein